MWLGQTLGLSVIFVLNTPPPLVKSNFQKAIFQKYLKTLFFEKRFKYPPPLIKSQIFNEGGGVYKTNTTVLSNINYGYNPPCYIISTIDLNTIDF